VKRLGSGKFEKVEAVNITRRISPDQEQTLRAVKSPEMVDASSPARGQEKTPKN
jgi:hypothetical protein